MFELPASFTGTGGGLLSFKSFKQLCYSLQGLGVITVKEIKEHKYPNNYYEALVTDGADNFSICENCYVKYLCFRIESEYEKIYLDKPEISSQISNLDPDVYVMDTEILNSPVMNSHLAKLSVPEKKEVKSWLPDNIGGVLFSWYFD